MRLFIAIQLSDNTKKALVRFLTTGINLYRISRSSGNYIQTE